MSSLDSVAQLEALHQRLAAGEAADPQLASALVARLDREPGRLQTLQCLRLLLRNLETARPLYNKESIASIVSVCDLAHYSAHRELSAEAVKCMVNFALRGLEIEKGTQNTSLVHLAFREHKWGALALASLQEEAKRDPESDDVFGLCRLLNMVLWDAPVLQELNGEPLVDVLVALLNHCIDALAKNSHEGPAIDTRRFSIAGDTLRMFFQLTQEYGPLNKAHADAAAAYPITSESAKLETEQEKKKPTPPHIAKLFSATMEPLKRALLFDYEDPRMGQLQLACVTYALNLPKEQVLQFDAYKVLPYLMKICEHYLTTGNGAASTSMLMLFTKIARDEPRTRAIFMMNMFPRWKEVFEADSGEGVRMPEQHNGTPGKLVIDAMQASETGLHFYANEFVFLLCNENAGAFTKFVGFGPAAGHLAVRGLMNMGGGGGGSGGGSGGGGGASNGQAPASLEGATRVTGWKEKKIDNPDMAHMSPEDVAEWNDLCDKMDRLDKLGVIQVMRKNDNNDKSNGDDDDDDDDGNNE